MKRSLLKFVAMLAFIFALTMPTQAAYGTNITDIATDANALFTSVFAIAVTIVASRIGLWVVRKIRS